MRSHHILLAVLCIFLGFACKPLYLPNTPNIPLMSEGDETQVGFTAGSNGYGLTLAYSPYYHWAVIGNGYTYSIPQDSTFTLKYRHLSGEIGTGFYTRLNKFARFETFFGYGQGLTGLPSDFGRYRKLWMQSSLGVSSSVLDMAVTLRPVFVNHFERKTDVNTEKLSNNSVFLEPYVTFRAGWENIKFQLQGGFATDFGSGNIPFQKLVGTLGIHLTFVKDFERYNWSP